MRYRKILYSFLALNMAVSACQVLSDTSESGNSPTQVSDVDGMVQVYVSAGEFNMGSDDLYEREKPIHTVYLDAFWIDQTEVTNAMFVEFLNQMGNQSEGGVRWFLGVGEGLRVVQSDDEWQSQSDYRDHPVVDVSWYGARAYCEWAGRRLPTEAEWEKAARGRLEGMMYPWGNEDPVCESGAENGAQYYDCGLNTMPVGTFAPNGYGLFDMAGNVGEWLADWYDEEYYNISPDSNPPGPASGEGRVYRGGTFGSSERGINSARRKEGTPQVPWYSVGFRCADSP